MHLHFRCRGTWSDYIHGRPATQQRTIILNTNDIAICRSAEGAQGLSLISANLFFGIFALERGVVLVSRPNWSRSGPNWQGSTEGQAEARWPGSLDGMRSKTHAIGFCGTSSSYPQGESAQA